MRTVIALHPGESGKSQGHHRDRLAVVYVRQSTVQPVERHQESTRLQSGLVERALRLGWASPRVLVIADDVGKAGSSAEGRPGVQRWVAAVSLNHVGIVLGIAMSRLARSCRDWHPLLEVGALVGTLIGDLAGVYDPSEPNARLLLGLQGRMSAAELHVLTQRMLTGKPAKAKRGAVGRRVPMGYFRRPGGDVIKDPDEPAQATIPLVFDQFERRGTIKAVRRYRVQPQLPLPHRVAVGLNTGDLDWRRPKRQTFRKLLRHPMYAGADGYGRRPTAPNRNKPGRPATGTRVAAPEQGAVVLNDRLPAYLSGDRVEPPLKQLDWNGNAVLGVARAGVSLLSGWLICGRGGLRMSASDNRSGHRLRYGCARAAIE